MMKSLYFTVKHFQISIMYSRSTCNRYKNMHPQITLSQRSYSQWHFSFFKRDVENTLG